MLKRFMKYNPAFLTESDLIQSFLARQTDFRLITNVVRDNVTGSNQHVLIIGPRGSGKTMLVLRIAAEIRQDPELNARWYPITFAEESYEIISAGEFWLEALFHLSEQVKEDRWRRTYEELSQERDNRTLRDRAIAQLMDFADTTGKRLLLIVENLNMLFNHQISGDDAWILRHTLLNEPRIMLLATATSRFEEIENSSSAMFELFKVHILKPLNEAECRAIWSHITGIDPEDDRIRPIQILTGGNPRLLAIIAGFSARLSLKELMNDLINMIDDHTEYFKSYLDNLAPTERKAYLALADLWDPATAKQVARLARLDVNNASALLGRLVGRGAVGVISSPKKTKWYQVTERMYNIYHLMRRRGAPSNRVKAIVNFMVSFYSRTDLVTMTRLIAEEACHVQSEQSIDHCQVYEGILRSIHSSRIVQEIFETTPPTFIESPHISSSTKELFAKRMQKPKLVPGSLKARSGPPKGEEKESIYYRSGSLATKDRKRLLQLMRQVRTLSDAPNKMIEAERIYREAIDLDPDYAWTWANLGRLLHTGFNRYEEAEAAYRKAIELEPDHAWAWSQLGKLLHENLNRYEEAEAAYRKAIELEPDHAWAWAQLGKLLHENLNRYEEAEAIYRKAIEVDSEDASVWTRLGLLLQKDPRRYEEAERAYRKAIQVHPEYHWAWERLGWFLHDKCKRQDEAEAAYKKAIELQPACAVVWGQLGRLLKEEPKRQDEAEAAYKKAIELEPKYAWAWAHLAEFLSTKPKRQDEAEAAYKKAIELEPKYAWAWAHLGRFLGNNLNRYEEAEAAYRKTIELEPEVVGQAWTWEQLGSLLHRNPKRHDEAEAAYRKAIELMPDNHWTWEQLGSLLHQNPKRHDEAEAAYRKAIELGPRCHAVWVYLGQLLSEDPKRCEETEVAFKKAVELKPDNAWVWTHLGEFLQTNVNRYKDAEEAYRKALKLNLEYDWAWEKLARLMFQEGRGDEMLRTIEEVLAQHASNAALHNTFAWLIYQYGGPRLLANAKALAERATEISPDRAMYQHTLLCIFIAEGEGKQALGAAEKYLMDVALVSQFLNDTVDLFVALVRLGYGIESLNVLQNSPCSGILEPLIVGIGLFIGQDVKCAVEILEVGKDIVRKIQAKD